MAWIVSDSLDLYDAIISPSISEYDSIWKENENTDVWVGPNPLWFPYNKRRIVCTHRERRLSEKATRKYLCAYQEKIIYTLLLPWSDIWASRCVKKLIFFAEYTLSKSLLDGSPDKRAGSSLLSTVLILRSWYAICLKTLYLQVLHGEGYHVCNDAHMEIKGHL